VDRFPSTRSSAAPADIAQQSSPFPWHLAPGTLARPGRMIFENPPECPGLHPRECQPSFSSPSSASKRNDAEFMQ
jgi:hypothetical protein